MMASFGTERNSSGSVTISRTYRRLPACAGPDSAAVTDVPCGVETTAVTLAWNIDDRDCGGNARTRCPTFTWPASCSGRRAVIERLAASIVPAVRTQI